MLGLIFDSDGISENFSKKMILKKACKITQ